MKKESLQALEKRAMRHLDKALSIFTKEIYQTHVDDVRDFENAIRQAHKVIALRMARRESHGNFPVAPTPLSQVNWDHNIDHQKPYPYPHDDTDIERYERMGHEQIARILNHPELDPRYPVLSKEKLEQALFDIRNRDWNPLNPNDYKAFHKLKGSIENTILHRGKPKDLEIEFPSINWATFF